MIKIVYWTSYKVPVVLVRFYGNLYFVDRLSKNKKKKKSNLMKIRPVGAELFHADRQKDMTKLTVVFRNFVLISDLRTGNEFYYMAMAESRSSPCIYLEKLGKNMKNLIYDNRCRA